VPDFVAVKDGVGFITVGTVSTKCNIKQKLKPFTLKFTPTLPTPTTADIADIKKELMILAKDEVTTVQAPQMNLCQKLYIGMSVAVRIPLTP
jgi:hypothetical protein